MYAYLIYIIQNLQDGKNAGSYKKTHLPANVPWKQKRQICLFFSMWIAIFRPFNFFICYISDWNCSLLLSETIKNVFAHWNKTEMKKI